MFLDEENLNKFLIGIIVFLIFVLFFGAYLLVDSFESESIMCPYCQRIYKIKFATKVDRRTVPPAVQVPSIVMMKRTGMIK